MRVERVQRARAHFENLNGRLGPALNPKPRLLAHLTRSTHIQQNGSWKGTEGVILVNASLRAADSLMTIVRL